MNRYRGFAQVEYDYVRGRARPWFDWAVFEQPSPRNRLTLPLTEARVALVATAGAHLPDQHHFDLGLGGDPSFREIPAGADELEFSHVGYDTRRARTDPDVVFPLRLLRRLEAKRTIGELAPRAYSFMGYIPEPEPLLLETGPRVAQALLADAVDLVLLVPS